MGMVQEIQDLGIGLITGLSASAEHTADGEENGMLVIHDMLWPSQLTQLWLIVMKIE